MEIRFQNDGKGKPQSVTAMADASISVPNGLCEIEITGFGATEAEAQTNLLAAASATITRLFVLTERPPQELTDET